MDRILSNLAIPAIIEYIVAFLVLFVVVFAATSYFLTGGKIGGTVRGFLSLLLFIVYGPFKFFHKSVVTVSGFRLADGGEKADDRQYLLVRFLTFLQAVLALVVIAMLATALIRAWQAARPEEYAREQAEQLDLMDDEIAVEYDTLNPSVAKYEADWSENKQALIDARTKERDELAAKAANENAVIETRLTDPAVVGIFTPIKQYMDNNRNTSSPRQVERIKSEVDNYIAGQSLPDDIRSQLLRYAENWAVVVKKDIAAASVTEEDYRAEIQPGYAAARSRLNDLEDSKREIADARARLAPGLKYKFDDGVVSLLYSLLVIILTIWFAGLLIEILWLNVDIARNVHLMAAAKTAPKERESQ